MELVTPGLGLVVWTTIALVFLLFILSRVAWKPIMKAISEREQSIENALLSAEKAREQMAQLSASNEQLLKEARLERERILKEAKEIKDGIIAEASKKASEEGQKMINNAMAVIEKEKQAAISELKTKVAELSIDMAEKILRKKFESRQEQEQLVNEYLQNINLN